MGTWSVPLFATVTPGKPEDYRIDLTKMSDDVRRSWTYSSFFNHDDSSKTSYTLTEFMNTNCDTHKIMDYMGNEQINKWLRLFEHIFSENPEIVTLQFHFFCSDSQEPFYFSYTRDDFNSSNKLNILQKNEQTYLYMYIGHSESINYFSRNKSWFKSNSDERQFKFKRDMYYKNWMNSNFRIVRLRVNSNSLF